jgi:hypothetical protein
VRPPPKASSQKTITIDGDLSDWEGVRPEFRDTARDTVRRSHRGWGRARRYLDRTGRNDFVTLKVAHDKKTISFYAETDKPITPHTDPNWMLLFIDSDQDANTGWEGYDYVVNKQLVSDRTTTSQRIGPGATSKVELPFAVAGNKLELRMPRSAIGFDKRTPVTFDFHWADNIQKHGDIIEFGVHGDSAPNRRFNYRYLGAAAE